jgi:hypothetical protein
MLSSLFVRHKIPQARFGSLMFLGLLIVFMWMGQYKPTPALTGIGVTLIIASVLIEANRDRIWEMYRKSYKKQKGLAGMMSKPNKVYYNLNVYFLWPVVFLIGVVSLFVAYMLSSS